MHDYAIYRSSVLNRVCIAARLGGGRSEIFGYVDANGNRIDHTGGGDVREGMAITFGTLKAAKTWAEKRFPNVDWKSERYKGYVVIYGKAR